MCELACKNESDCQQDCVPTARVLDHLEHELNIVRGGIEVAGTTQRVPARIMLLAGSDLVQTMSQPGVWKEKDVRGRPGFCAFLSP